MWYAVISVALGIADAQAQEGPVIPAEQPRRPAHGLRPPYRRVGAGRFADDLGFEFRTRDLVRFEGTNEVLEVHRRVQVDMTLAYVGAVVGGGGAGAAAGHAAFQGNTSGYRPEVVVGGLVAAGVGLPLMMVMRDRVRRKEERMVGIANGRYGLPTP